MVVSIGSYISAAAAVFFVYVLLHTLLAGRKCEANPWGEGASSLEWSQTSPPPFHTYAELPVIK